MAKQPEQTTIPRALPMLVGLTAGLLAALTVAVRLTAMDMPVAGAWSQLAGGEPLQFAAASVLWAIAGVAFVVGAAAAALMTKYPPPWRGLRALRWIAGAVVLFGLAHVAHGVQAPDGVSPGLSVAADMSAIAIASAMALFGAFFARPR